MPKKLLFAVLILAFLSGGSATAQLQHDTSNILFSNANTFPKRFLYSQVVLWPSAISAHIGLYIAKDDFDWNNAVRLSMYKKTFTQLPRFDTDHWSWNYEVHPYMGSQSYLAYRNRRASILESFAGTALNSLIYEYVIAGGTQTPSWNDMIATSLGGSILGEGLYQVKKYILRDNYLTVIEKLLITICDPIEVLYFGFNYHKLSQNSYR